MLFKCIECGKAYVSALDPIGCDLRSRESKLSDWKVQMAHLRENVFILNETKSL